MLIWLIEALVVLAFAGMIASVWVPGPLILIGLLMLGAAGVLMAIGRRVSGRRERTLDPLLRGGPLVGKQIGRESERPVHAIDQFAGFARTEGMAELGEAMTQERLRAQSPAARDLS